jgi:hypothetical protein
MIPVKVSNVAEEFDGLMDEMHAYLNRQTRETYGLTDEEIHLVEEVDKKLLWIKNASGWNSRSSYIV